MTRDIILLIHSLFGVVILATGLLQIILKKGGRLHRVIGQLYLYGWVFLLATGAYLGGLLISIVGVFGFYFALTGARIGTLKSKPVQLFDKVIFVTSGLVACSMLYYAVRLYLGGEESFGIIFAVFGLIFTYSTAKDIVKYMLARPSANQEFGKLDWYFEHFTRMFISFIAAVTAFVSIQNLFLNNTLNFLLPTVLGTIAIHLTKKAYRKKLIPVNPKTQQVV